MNKTIHYSVASGGDGSAYPVICDSLLVSQIHQRILVNSYEGWGEECIGSITLSSDAAITFAEGEDVMTASKLIEELNTLLDDDWMNIGVHVLKQAIEELQNSL